MRFSAISGAYWRFIVCLLAPKGQAKHTGILTEIQTKVKKKNWPRMDTDFRIRISHELHELTRIHFRQDNRIRWDLFWPALASLSESLFDASIIRVASRVLRMSLEEPCGALFDLTD